MTLTPFTETTSEKRGIKGYRSYAISGTGDETLYAPNNEHQYQTEHQITRSGFRRKRPTNLGANPLPYTFDRYSPWQSGENQRARRIYPGNVGRPGYNQEGGVKGVLLARFDPYVTYRSNTAIVNGSLIDARLKLKDMKVNLGLAFMERAKTANLFQNYVTSIAHSIRSFRRRRFREAFRHLGIQKPKDYDSLRNVGQKWLELQYGWTPFMSDLFGACEALAGRNIEDFDIRVSGFKGQEEDYSIAHYDVEYGNFTQHVKDIQGCRTVLRYRPGDNMLREFSSLGLTNPAELVWELIPYSFVLDWFIPVGDWLSQLDADVGWVFLSGTRSVRKELKVRYSGFGPNSYDAYSYRDTSTFDFGYSRFRLERTTFETSPVAALPSVGTGLGSHRRIASALSLLGGVLGRQGSGSPLRL